MIVSALPATRSGAPGAFYPTLAAMEIDRALFGPDPTQVHPTAVGDEDGYGAAWGVFTHEGAHAAHSLWNPPEGSDPAIAEAANLLEESRAEKRQADRRPVDGPWLRKSASTLILDEITADMPGDRWGAAHAAGLILARRDGGILAPDETAALEWVARTILGRETLGECGGSGRRPTRPATVSAAMMKLGEQWLKAIGTASGQEVSAEELAEAVGGHRTDRAERRARGTRGLDPQGRRRPRRRQGQRGSRHPPLGPGRQGGVRTHGQARRQAPDPGRPGALPGRARRRRETRPRAARRRLPRTDRDGTHLRRPARTPLDARRPGPRRPTRRRATPDRRTLGHHHPPPRPDPAPAHRDRRRHLRLHGHGHRPTARQPGSWPKPPQHRPRVQDRHRRLRPDPERDHPARAHPALVTEFAAPHGGHNLAGAIDALDGGLGLTRPGAGRLLVIASDGWYGPDEEIAAAERINRLLAHGMLRPPGRLRIPFPPDPRRHLPGTDQPGHRPGRDRQGRDPGHRRQPLTSRPGRNRPGREHPTRRKEIPTVTTPDPLTLLETLTEELIHAGWTRQQDPAPAPGAHGPTHRLLISPDGAAHVHATAYRRHTRLQATLYGRNPRGEGYPPAWNAGTGALPASVLIQAARAAADPPGGSAEARLLQAGWKLAGREYEGQRLLEQRWASPALPHRGLLPRRRAARLRRLADHPTDQCEPKAQLDASSQTPGAVIAALALAD